MLTLLVATTNVGKLEEIQRVLASLPMDLVSLETFASVDAPAESGETFAENAREKARHYARASGLLTVAEDSGLVIDALDGAPGVFSKRVPGDTYPQKFQRLFDMLDARGAGDSTARFVCAVALARHDAILYESSAAVAGVLTRTPRGAGGFGYDPIFYYPPLGRTLAELSQEEKTAVSHRGQAFRALRSFLERREFAF